MTKGYVKSESYIVLPSGLEISLGRYNRFKYRKEVVADMEIKFRNLFDGSDWTEEEKARILKEKEYVTDIN